MKATIRFHVNGKPVSVGAGTGRTLLSVLRTELGLTGAKYGCGEGHCGACTVLMDGSAVRSCVVPLQDAAGKRVTTIEGMAAGRNLHPLQQAFVEHGALQCGFCTPGMLIAAYDLLQHNPQPSRGQVIEHMEPHLCRCGAYQRIVDAILSAAQSGRGRT